MGGKIKKNFKEILTQISAFVQWRMRFFPKFRSEFQFLPPAKQKTSERRESLRSSGSREEIEVPSLNYLMMPSRSITDSVQCSSWPELTCGSPGTLSKLEIISCFPRSVTLAG